MGAPGIFRLTLSTGSRPFDRRLARGLGAGHCGREGQGVALGQYLSTLVGIQIGSAAVPGELELSDASSGHLFPLYPCRGLGIGRGPNWNLHIGGRAQYQGWADVGTAPGAMSMPTSLPIEFRPRKTCIQVSDWTEFPT